MSDSMCRLEEYRFSLYISVFKGREKPEGSAFDFCVEKERVKRCMGALFTKGFVWLAINYNYNMAIYEVPSP